MIGYKIIEHDDLIYDNSSLILGWIIIDGYDFFKETNCMLVITLTDLMEGLQRKSRNFIWYAADSGETAFVRMQQDILYVDYNSKTYIFDYSEFISSLFQTCNKLCKELVTHRPEVVEEAAYIDLLQNLMLHTKK